MATVIPVNGTPYEVAPADGVFTLPELQKIVGGYIEVLQAPDGRICYLNEEGKLRKLPVNIRATALLRKALRPDDVIVGDVILCTRAETGDE